jgi:hypothetical protein
MEPNRYGWEALARRSLLSPEVELKTLPGFRVRARKYSVAAADEIHTAQMRKRDQVPIELRKLMARAEEEGKGFAEVAAALPQEEAELLLSRIVPETSSVEDLMRLALLHGIGEHNLNDGTRCEEGVSRELVDRLMEYPALAEELHRIILEWNSPLRKATPAASGTSPNGSTGAPPSPPESGSLTAPSLES